MSKVMGMDSLESLVLDFLAYRRERREMVNRRSVEAVTLEEAVQDPAYQAAIGKGWPHYRGMLSRTPNIAAPQSEQTTKTLPLSHSPIKSDIIPTLSPIVDELLSAFGTPDNAQALVHLTNQIIARAMTIPAVAESMSVAETIPWGRAQLLQSVVELLILIQMGD